MPLPKYNFTPNKDTLIKYALPIIIGVIAISVIIWFIYSYAIKKSNVGFKPNSEHILQNSGGSSNECEILIFSTTWCPHCKKAKPIWEEVKQEYSGKTVNGHTIIFTEVDCTNESPDVSRMMDKFKIEGYPTVKMVKDGQIIEFDANVTKSNMEQFINTAV